MSAAVSSSSSSQSLPHVDDNNYSSSSCANNNCNTWVEALAIVKFDEKHGQQIQCAYPTGRLSEQLLSRLKMLAMPDCLESGATNHEVIFLIRTNDCCCGTSSDLMTPGGGDSSSSSSSGVEGLIVASPTPLYCYVSFRQCQDQSTQRGYFQQSLVLLSKLPLHSLHFSVLSRLSSVLADIPGFEMYTTSNPIADNDTDTDNCNSNNRSNSNSDSNSNSNSNGNNSNSSNSSSSSNSTSNSSSNSIKSASTSPRINGVNGGGIVVVTSQVNKSIHLPFDLTILESTIEVAFQHFVQWPPFRSGLSYNLPFYGSIIPFIAPMMPLYALPTSLARTTQDNFLDILRRGHQGADKDSGLFSSVNVFSVFGRLGLLPHIWTLWELVVTGKDIIVWSQNAAISSAVVLALVSLASPFGFCGDFRPYMNSYDPDVSYLSDVVASRAVSPFFSSSSPSDATRGSPSRSPSRPPQASLLVLSQASIPSSNGGATSTSTTSKTTLNSPPGNKPKVPGSVIIGITNPFLLRSFGSAHACILLPNPESKKPKLNIQTTPKSEFNQFCSYVTTGMVESPPTSPISSKKNLSQSSGFFLSNVSSFISSTFGFGPTSAVSEEEQSGVNKNSYNSYSSNGNGNGGDSGDRKPSLELHQGTSFRFSPLGLAVVQDTSSSSPSNGFKSDFSSPAFECTFNVMGVTSSESLETVYDDWSANGGGKAGSSRRYSVLAVRSKPTVSPDSDVLSNLLALQKNQLDITSNGAALSAPVNLSKKVSVRQDDRCWADEDDKSVIGNMMLRGHFQSLNLELSRPFECLFALPPTDIISMASTTPILSRPNSFASSTASTATTTAIAVEVNSDSSRRGATVLSTIAATSTTKSSSNSSNNINNINNINNVNNSNSNSKPSLRLSESLSPAYSLYASLLPLAPLLCDPIDLLPRLDFKQALSVEGHISTLVSKCMKHSSSSWQELALKVAQTDHFSSWCSWRREIISNIWLVSSCDASISSKDEITQALETVDWKYVRLDHAVEVVVKLNKCISALEGVLQQIGCMKAQAKAETLKAKRKNGSGSNLPTTSSSYSTTPSSSPRSGFSSSTTDNVAAFIYSSSDEDLVRKISQAVQIIQVHKSTIEANSLIREENN